MGNKLAYSIDEAQKAVDDWGFNCGPAALTAITGLCPGEIRGSLGDFEKKGYINPMLMYTILNCLGLDWQVKKGNVDFPDYGLARVQWEGPWTEEGVHWAVRQRHTHWVACRRDRRKLLIFDVNAICVGGWLNYEEWAGSLVPWLLKEVESEANGLWYVAHSIEVKNGQKK